MFKYVYVCMSVPQQKQSTWLPIKWNHIKIKTFISVKFRKHKNKKIKFIFKKQLKLTSRLGTIIPGSGRGFVGRVVGDRGERDQGRGGKGPGA